MKKRSVAIAAIALALTIGSINIAQAESASDQLAWKQVAAAGFNEHGGGHETAPDNARIHDLEMKTPGHKNAFTPNPKAAFNEHGGGHETAPDNMAIHAQEMKDPNHKDPAAQ